jgi:hypothetical protein
MPRTNARTQVGAIIDWLQADRHLQFRKRPTTPVFVSAAQMQKRLAPRYRAGSSVSTARTASELWAALGEAPNGYDLRSASIDLYSAPAGIYLPETGEIMVRSSATSPLTPAAMVTVAHELEHALEDQRVWPKKTPELTADQRLAHRALVEGDATLEMLRFNLAAFGADPKTLQLNADTELSPARPVAQFPPTLIRFDLAPYAVGFAYTCRTLANSGWQAINAAYAAPKTSAEEMFDDPEYRTHSSDAAMKTPEGWQRAQWWHIGALEMLIDFDNGRVANPLPAVSSLQDAVATQFRVDGLTAIDITMTDDGTNHLCLAVHQWVRTVPTLRREARVRCRGDVVLFDTVHTPR